MIRAFLLLGSNEGDRQTMLDAGRVRIHLLAGKIEAASSLYETAAWGKPDQPPFLNQVIALETSLSPEILLVTTQAIERSLGRVNKGTMESRTLDIDILLYGDRVVNEPALVIPHTAMGARRFVLVPLNELIPDEVHPVTHKTISEMLANCSDPLSVAKLPQP